MPDGAYLSKPLYASRLKSLPHGRSERSALHPRLRAIGEVAWRKADGKLAAIRDTRGLTRARAALKTVFAKLFGPLPDPSSRIGFRLGKTRVFQGVAVQQVVLRSALGYGISALVYRKRNLRGPVPGLVFASGHEERASCHPPYAQFCMFAAMRGFLVVAFDPPGQGPRREVFLAGDDPVHWRTTAQHQHLGAVTTLVGSSLSHFFVHDAVTAVSFLCQRPEVDASRVGFAGHSGGGLQTYWAMAADSRIRVAVAIKSGATRRVAFRNGQLCDIEQCPPHAWSLGFDLHEMAALFVPRPLQIIAEPGHVPQGDVYRKLKPIYQRLGHPENLEFRLSTPAHELGREDCDLALQWLGQHLAPTEGIPAGTSWKGWEPFCRGLQRDRSGTDLRHEGILRYCRKEARAARPSLSGTAHAIKGIPILREAFRRRRGVLRNVRGGMLHQPAPGVYGLEFGAGDRVPVVVNRGRCRNGVVALVVDEEGRNSSRAKQYRRAAASLSEWVVAMEVFPGGDGHARAEDPGSRKEPWFSEGVQRAMESGMAGHCPIGLALGEIRALLVAPAWSGRPLLLFGRGWPAVSLLLLSATIPHVIGCYLSGIPRSYEMLREAGRFCVDYSGLVPGILKVSDIPIILRAHPQTSYVLASPLEFGRVPARVGGARVERNVLHLPRDDGSALKEAIAWLRPAIPSSRTRSVF